MRGVVTLLFAGVLASGCSATPVATATATPTVTATSTATPTATAIPTATPTVTAAPGDAVILSHLYALEWEVVILERFDGTGGAIESLGDELLVVTPKGRLALVAGDGEVVYLDGRVPMNLAGRTADILVKEAGAGQYELFATHHYLSGECIRFRLSVTTLLHDGESATVLPNWRTVFDAEPCLPLRWSTLHWAGGKMLGDGAEHLLVLTGGHGKRARPSFDTDDHFGKLLRIDIESGEAEVLAIGFRNPQGLTRDAEGRLWAPDHGPQGGDELNLLERGGHYGWPLVTYGVEYGGMVPPEFEDAELGRHEGFRRPAFAWVPAVAVSAITVNDADWFPLWKDDLLVASLKAGSLFRVRRVGTEVQYVEKIEIGIRIRDLATLPDGRIALLQDGGRVHFLRRSPRYCDEEARERRDVYSIDCESIPALPTPSALVAEGQGAAVPFGSADAADGAQLYSTHCGSCHNQHVEQHGPGPHLVEVSGRRVGDELGGFGFSEALRALDGVWTRDKLQQYLADPQEFAPGTSMASPNISEAEAGAIANYLHSLYPPGELVGDAAPAIEADFEVWLAEGQLVYWREDCAAEDVDAPFFLHLVPLDVGDLPESRQQFGFENLNFDFERYGTRDGETCLALVSLRTYDIAEIHTGQYVARDGGFENLWAGAIWTEAPLKRLAAQVERLIGGRAPAIEADFEVWLAEGQLVYRREDCAAEDMEATFFLHLVPLEVGDLPAEQREYGFESLSFRFERYGTQVDESCMALVPLPAYDIVEIHTGQFVARDKGYDNLWKGTIRPA